MVTASCRLIASCSTRRPIFAALIDELIALHGTVRIGLDVIGGIVGLAGAMLA